MIKRKMWNGCLYDWKNPAPSLTPCLRSGTASRVVITGRAQALKKAQAVLARYVDPGTLVSEEWIAERKRYW
jgi:hypothetical protein